MAEQENTSTSSTVTDRDFHHGLFKINDGINLQEKLEQASLFLDAAHDGIDEMVASGEANIRTLWGFSHMLGVAKALLDSANAEVAKGATA